MKVAYALSSVSRQRERRLPAENFHLITRVKKCRRLHEGGPADSSHWFWLLSGQIEAVLIFAGLSVAVLFLYWSRIGPILDESE
jgi:hypothetical protein